MARKEAWTARPRTTSMGMGLNVEVASEGRIYIYTALDRDDRTVVLQLSVDEARSLAVALARRVEGGR